jgi:hypothetical protein
MKQSKADNIEKCYKFHKRLPFPWWYMFKLLLKLYTSTRGMQAASANSDYHVLQSIFSLSTKTKLDNPNDLYLPHS